MITNGEVIGPFTWNLGPPRPLFLTIGSGDTPYGGMVRDHEVRHRAYCEKWGYDYRAVFDFADVWLKLELTLEAMQSGHYSHVFIIDADAIVVDFETDLRTCLPSWAFLGLTTHPYPMLDVWHWNVGCSFWQTSQQGIEFLQETLKARGRPQWHEQAEINAQLMDNPERWQSGFVQLPRHFNNNWHDQPLQDAVVLAWHGYMDPEGRRTVMNLIAQDYPYEPASH